MKKYLIISGIALLLAAGFIAMKVHYAEIELAPARLFTLKDSAAAAKLESLGFSRLAEVQALHYARQRSYWKSRSGLVFYGDEEMKKFLDDNNFIVGGADRYLKEIPANVATQIAERLKRLQDSADKEYEQSVQEFNAELKQHAGWTIQGGGSGVIVYGNSPNRKTYSLQVVAGAGNFNTDGLNIIDRILKANPPIDPIAVVKVPEGYLELANW